MAHLLAKQINVFFELMISCLIVIAEEMCPEKSNLFKTVILLVRPVAEQFNDIWEPYQ